MFYYLLCILEFVCDIPFDSVYDIDILWFNNANLIQYYRYKVMRDPSVTLKGTLNT